MKKIDRENPNTSEYWNKTAIDDGFLTNIKVNKNGLCELINEEIVGKAIDIGAGSGMLTKSLNIVSACDFSVPAVEQLKTIIKDVFWCDILDGIKEPDKSFDTVISTETLEHFDNPEIAVKELVRLARKKVIVTVPKGDHGLNSREHVWLFDEQDIKDMFIKYGEVKTIIYENTILGVCTIST